ncbi:MAG: hypothetical protein ACE5LU_06595 [Anaerolineae bacterium]
MDTSEFARPSTSSGHRFEERGVAGWPDDQIHVTLDVSDTIEAKWAALQCHRTQFGPDNLFRRLPEDVLKEMMSREHFALAGACAWPAVTRALRWFVAGGYNEIGNLLRLRLTLVLRRPGCGRAVGSGIRCGSGVARTSGFT